jgi:hypothetical protein
MDVEGSGSGLVNVLYRHLHGQNEETTKNLSHDRQCPGTMHVPYISQERYHYTKPIGEYDVLKVLPN